LNLRNVTYIETQSITEVTDYHTIMILKMSQWKGLK